jgi:hypothetical protein
VRQVLPQGWRLDAFDVERPSLAGLHIRRAELFAQLADMRVETEATDVTVAWHEWRVHAHRIRLRAMPATASEQPLGLDDLVLPGLNLPPDLPPAHIERLDVSIPAAGLEVRFGNLHLESIGDTQRLTAQFDPVLFPGHAGLLELHVGAGVSKLEVRIPAGEDPAPLAALHLRQQTTVSSIESRLNIELQLHALDPSFVQEWASFLTQNASNASSVSGAIALEFEQLAGNGRREIRLRGEQLSFIHADHVASADLTLEGEIADHLTLRASGDSALRLRGPAAFWLDYLSSALPGLEFDPFSPIIDAELRLAPGTTLRSHTGIPAPETIAGHFDAVVSAGERARATIGGGSVRAEFPVDDWTRGELSVEGRLQFTSLAAAACCTISERLHIEELAVEGAARLRLRPDSASRFVFDGFDLQAAGADLTLDGNTFGAPALMAHGNLAVPLVVGPWPGTPAPGIPVGEIDLSATNAFAVVDGIDYRDFDASVSGRLDSPWRFRGDAAIHIHRGPEFALRIDADFEQATATARLPPTVVASSQLEAFLRYVGMQTPADLHWLAGEVILEGDFSAAEDVTGKATVSGRDLEVGYGKSRAHNISTDLMVTFAEQIHTRGTIEAPGATLAAGFELTTASLGLRALDSEDVVLLRPHINLFDGEISSERIHLLRDALQTTNVTWRGFDLAALLAALDISGLSATGQIDAHIPLDSEGDALVVKAGRFEARTPGSIRFRSAVPAKNIGLRALENFQYDTLRGTLGYDAEGGYEISIHLLGRNPELYDGHPIRLNLTVNGVLPSLFQSLFLTGDFEGAIVEQWRSGQLEPQ